MQEVWQKSWGGGVGGRSAGQSSRVGAGCAERPELRVPSSARRLDRAEEAVRLVVDPGGEQQGGRVAGDAVAEAERPQAVDLDHAAILVPEPPEELARRRVVGVDAAVAEVAHQQGAAEAPEARRGERQAPRGVQLAVLDQMAEQLAAGRVDVDEAKGWAGDGVM